VKLRRQEFERFVERKTMEALRAELPPYVTELERRDGLRLEVGNAWTRRLFDGPFYVSESVARQPACSLVFVQSLNGNTGAANPETLGGGQTDKHLIYEGLSRVAADAVLSGASTVRAAAPVLSVWHPELVALRSSLGKPRHPVQIVATLEGINLDTGLMFNVPELEVCLVTVPSGADAMRAQRSERPWVRTIVMEDRNGLRGAFEALRTAGVARLSCIGGRRFATHLIDAGLVQDVYLTTAAAPGGEPGTPMYPRTLDTEVIVRKHGTGVEAGVRFEHLRLRRNESPRPSLRVDVGAAGPAAHLLA
jgi:riboflavin biosynthesis pyrimidine reductase